MKHFNVQKPIVSVIIATYNRKEIISRAIESVLCQSFSDYEIIVVDDGSTDGTRDRIKELISSKVHYFYENNAGPDVARDLGIRKSKGKYIAILDSDDYWVDKDKLRKQVKFLDENLSYVLVGGNASVVNELGQKIVEDIDVSISDEEIREKILIENPFIHVTAMYRKSTWEKVGGYGKNSRGFSEDWNLWLKMGKIGKIYNFKDKFACYRAGGGYSSLWRKQSVLLDLKLRMVYGRDYPHFIKGYVLGFLYYLSFFIPFRKYARLCFYKLNKK